MSVLRIPRKIKTFEYEGQKFGIRRLYVGEMAELTRLTSLYLRSTRSELKEIVADKIEQYAVVQGDLNLMHEAQVYLAKTAVIDPETNSQVFNVNQTTNDVDNDFISAAWNAYNSEDVKTEVKESSDRPLDQRVTPVTTTSDSEETSSISPDIST